MEILSKLQNLPNLSDYDIDENIEPEIDCNYYNVQEFQSIKTSAKDISLFPLNIRSLHLHFDELFTLLANTGTVFEIMGRSETKYTREFPKHNSGHDDAVERSVNERGHGNLLCSALSS